MDSVGGGKNTQCELGWQLRGRWAVVDVPLRVDGGRVGGDGGATRQAGELRLD
jgi:hypothetical protein